MEPTGELFMGGDKLAGAKKCGKEPGGGGWGGGSDPVTG